MGITNRLWSRETSAPDENAPLAQRLRDLVGSDLSTPPENDTGEPAGVAVAEKSATRPAPPDTDPRAGESISRLAERDRGQQEKVMENSSPEIPEAKRPGEEPSREPAPSSPASRGPGRQFMERFHAAVDRADPATEKSPASNWETPPDFQSIQKQFEADFRKRIDGALAEFESRISSQALVDDVAGQIEQRIRLAADGIFKEVKSQAWTMHSAVAGELRAFRDQFGKEIEERVGMLDQAAQQALQSKEKLEETIPRAEDAVRSLSVSSQEASDKFEAAAKGLEEQLRRTGEELSREIESQMEMSQTLSAKLRQEASQLNEQMETFRGESAAARDHLGSAADQSLEKVNAAAEETGARAREGIENLAREIERRILSGGLVERATERLGEATQEMVEPALDRLRKATEESRSAAESLSTEGQRVAGQLDSAREQIEARLDGLLGEQLNLIEGAMTGFQRKASEDLGGLVERVVAQSTSQLDDRLHGLLQDLFATTSQQINTVARASLTNMNEGLKEAFKPQGSGPLPDSGSPDR